MYRRLFFSLFLLFGLNNLVFAQNNKLITGRVIDKESKQPIENAEVFISGATTGTTTNKNGEFSLISPHTPCHLGVMHVSYQSVVLPISSGGNFNIELADVSHNIKEVRVTAKNLRRKNLRLFYRNFLYATDKRHIKVLNDSVLQFMRDDYDFHAYCKSPLLVENKYLGYRIKILIKDFHVCKKKLSNGEKVTLNSVSGTEVFKLKGYYYYQEKEKDSPRIQSVIDKNRQDHYYGSLRHFLSGLYNDKLIENGFKLKSETNKLDSVFNLVSDNSEVKRFAFAEDEISVTYFFDENKKPLDLSASFDICYYANSKIISFGKEFEVRANGTSPDLSFELKGEMGQRSPVNTLPNDYEPE